MLLPMADRPPAPAAASARAPATPDAGEILMARDFLAPHLPATRIVRSPSLSRALGRPVHLKLESELPTGSFKVRGALWALACRLSEGEVSEVVTASTGNHGAAVAFAGRRLGVPATVFLPRDPNHVKRRRIEELGARTVAEGPDLTAAREAAARHARGPGRFLLDDATDPHLPAGPATIALEALEAAAGLDTFLVPVGDTALIRGIGAALSALERPRRPQLIGVQAEGAPAYALSWGEGRAVHTEACHTIADGLATRTAVAANVEAIRRLVGEMVLVGEERLLAAVRHLVIEERLVAEPAGAAAVAAFFDRVDAGDGLPGTGEICLLVSGANTTPEVLRRALEPPG